MGALIIHSPAAMKEDWDPNNESGDTINILFKEGSWNCNFADEVKPEGSDTILNNRTKASAFEGTPLEETLKTNGIKRLFIMGFLSNISVEETARGAFDLFPEMRVYVLVDGCAAKTKEVSSYVQTDCFLGKL